MSNRHIINAVDVQVTGETGRILLDQYLRVKGADMAARLAYCREHLNDLREMVLREPRGHAHLMGVLVVPPVEPASDFGVIIMEQADFAAMSGANLMCAITAVLEGQHMPVQEPTTQLRIDTPAGTLEAIAYVAHGRVVEIQISNVPAFVTHLQTPVDVPEFGEILVDVSFGGQFYVQAPAASFGLDLTAERGPEIIRTANMLLAAAREQIRVAHPLQPHLNRIDLPILYGPPHGDDAHGRGAVVLPLHQPTLSNPLGWHAGTLDRSPGGTGTCARMAVEYAKGNLSLGEDFIQQSLLNTTFTGRLEESFLESGYTMVRPTLRGRGWVLGQRQLVVESDDPFPTGFTL